MKSWCRFYFILCIMASLAFQTACGGADDDDDTGPDGDTDTDADADGDADSDSDNAPVDAGPWELRCDPDGVGTGERCSTTALCNCDNVCGANLFEASNELPQQFLDRFPNFNPDNFGVFSCYAKCDPAAPACPNATDVCTTVGEESVREASLCIPTGGLTISDIPLKVYQEGVPAGAGQAAWSAVPAANITTNDVGLPTAPSSILSIRSEDQTAGTSRVTSTALFGLPLPLEGWYLITTLDGVNWTNGSVLNVADTGVAVTLWRFRGGTLWYEGPATAGTVTVVETQPFCLTVEDCPLSTLSLDVTILQSKIGFRNNGQ
jgi:hypothetical protein